MEDFCQKVKNYAPKHAQIHLIMLCIFIIVGIGTGNNYIVISSIVLLLFVLYFFRIKEVSKDLSEDFAFAPSYGRVVKVREFEGHLQIAMFISVLDAHIQYAPCGGKITEQIYKDGQFNSAYFFEKTELNEKLIHKIETSRGEIKVAQIAGLIARTIVPFVKVGEEVVQNQEIGLIKFGSSCHLFIPLKGNENMKVLIKEGDYVEGGITKIVQFE